MNDTDFNGLSGTIITPLSAEYNAKRQQWNKAIQKYPAVIVYCINYEDVANALFWARENAYAIRIRNGCHNYEGYSTGNGVAIIDMSLMNNISVRGNSITIEGGVQNYQLYRYLSTGDYPFPGGNCPTVGVCGSVLGGGWGLSCRFLGLGCDQLSRLSMIDADGNLLTVDEDHNPDLYWACRGAGGGNFGVVVSMTFELSEKAHKVNLIDFQYTNIDINKQRDFIGVWQKWLENADEKITLMAKIFRTGQSELSINCKGLYYGSEINSQEILQPFIDIDANIKLDIRQTTFNEAIEIIENAHPEYEMFKSTGRFVTEPINEQDAEELVSILSDFAEGSVYSALTFYALGGKVAEKENADTAFYYRNAKYIIGLQSVWTDEIYAQKNIAWIDKKFPILEKMTAGSYINFPYARLRDPMKAYYGANIDRLREIKKKYDPQNIFGFSQSIH